MNSELTYLDEFGKKCTDLLNSKNYINEFRSIVENTNVNVYGLTGDWGIGKTCFIKMWEGTLSNGQYLHIDAFKNDFNSEPFIMLLNAFTRLLKDNTGNNISSELQELKNKAKEIFTLKNISKLGLNIIFDKTIGKSNAEEFLGTAFDSCFEDYSKIDSLHDKLKEILSELIGRIKDRQLYIIIDELDRCRPDFALETFERIKHLFHVKQVKYILVYNEKAMNSIINNKYGSEIDANRYIDKFIQLKYQFKNIFWQKKWFSELLENTFQNSDKLSMY
jgi:hypothetical protein